MKKLIITTILTATLATSCSLNPDPETDLTDKGFWKTETDLRGACKRLDNLLSGFWHDTRADELVKVSADDISSGNRTVPSTSGNWTDPYYRIFTANNIIDKSVNANVTDEVRNRWVGEARFFRAYYYFELVKKYGDVPLILKAFNSTDDPEITKPRDSREAVIAQCYDDLEFAAQWLPTRATLKEKDWGHVTKSAALAMIARVGLYEGTYEKYHNLSATYNEHLQKSVKAAEQLMLEGHELYPDYQKLFYFDGEGPTNKENIMVKVYGPNGAGTVTHGNCRQMENSVSVTRQMIDLYLYADGLPKSKTALKTSPETSFNDALTNRDPRLNMTVFSVGEEGYKGSYIPLSNQGGFGYSLKKGFMLDEWSTNSKETVDKMLIRYGEMLITYAEALYELNGNISDENLDKTVNALRNRAGFAAQLTNAFATANGLDMLEEIRRERTVELIDEGFRYDDIIRWKIAEKVLPTYILGGKYVESETDKIRKDLENRLTDNEGRLNGVAVYDEPDIYVIELKDSRKFDPKRDYLYPIPLEEISLSKNNVTQNPGWE